ncbi:MAG TPA: hypothetical protein VMS77_01375 [Conexivisphaerales archaeon]|nr:hypothetical protein [Conexivisphaerales archaeon]
MRYKVVLQNAQRYEAVIYRDIDEPKVPEDTSATERKLILIEKARAAVLEEMKDNPTFTITRIEEAPLEFREESY